MAISLCYFLLAQTIVAWLPNHLTTSFPHCRMNPDLLSPQENRHPSAILQLQANKQQNQAGLYSKSKDEDDKERKRTRNELRIGPFGSLELIAIVVSLVFLVTVYGAGDALFAKPSPTTTKIVDADEILQEDFWKSDSPVSFSEE